MGPYRIMTPPLMRVLVINKRSILALAGVIVSLNSLTSLNAQENTSVASSPEQLLSIRFVEPVNEDIISGVVSLKIESNSDNPLSQVSFYRSNELLGVIFDAPYALFWDTNQEADGPYTLVAKAIDESFQAATAALNVKVDNSLPTVELLEPQDGAKVVGEIEIHADGSDLFGIDKIRILLDGKNLVDLSSQPYRYKWDSSSVSNDDHIIEARAFDYAGNVVTSRPIKIRTGNFNQAPVLEPIEDKTLLEKETLEFTIAAHDPDGGRDRVTYSAENLPDWASLDENKGVIHGMPDSSVASQKKPKRTYPIVRIFACDPEPLCDTKEFVITVLNRNRAPEFNMPGTKATLLEGSPLAFSLDPSDADDDPFICIAKYVPPWAEFNQSTCSFQGTPPLDLIDVADKPKEYGGVIFRVCDNQDLCTSKELAITVMNKNSAPIWVYAKKQQGREGEMLIFDVLAQDPDGDTVSVAGVSLPNGVRFEELGGGAGRFFWRPQSDQSGIHKISFLATDTVAVSGVIVPVEVEEAILSLSGFIKDKKGNPVRDVNVSISASASTLDKTDTNESGFYLFDKFKTGTYVIRPAYTVKAGVASGRPRIVEFIPQKYRLEVVDEDLKNINFQIDIR